MSTLLDDDDGDRDRRTAFSAGHQNAMRSDWLEDLSVFKLSRERHATSRRDSWHYRDEIDPIAGCAIDNR
jgi:hypothetical protein